MFNAASKKDKLFVNYINKLRPYASFKYHVELFEILRDAGDYSVNEIIRGEQKPFLAVRKIFTSKEEFQKKYQSIMSQLVKSIVKVFRENYTVRLKLKDIVILDNSHTVENGYMMSCRMIISPANFTYYYKKGVYGNSHAYHFYELMTEKNSIYCEYLDGDVYDTDELAIIGSDVNGEILMPVDSKTIALPEDKINLCRYLLTHIDKTHCKKIVTPFRKTGSIDDAYHGIPVTRRYHEILIDTVKKHHESACYIGSSDMCHNFCYSDKRELCPIGKCMHNDDIFGVYESKGRCYLKCYSEECEKNDALFIGYLDETDEFLASKKVSIIDRQFLPNLIDEETEDEVVSMIIEWLQSNTKTLAVKSAMGTGKTTLTKAIIRYDLSLLKILWISHRQTLTNYIHGEFSKENFVNYMEHHGSLFGIDRIIVQLDSITRINKIVKDGKMFQDYDLVIIDEVEGYLNHYSSPYLIKRHGSSGALFEFVNTVIQNARKLLILDADFGARAKIYMESFGEYVMINNTYVPDPKKFTFVNNYDFLINDLMDRIKKGENVCVVSMSSKAINEITKTLEKMNEEKNDDEKIKVCIHTKDSPDSQKEELKDVNAYWSQFQVVLYSPTIECGIDFHEEHFDKVYCIIKNGKNTCSQRSLLQMIGRIRKVKDSEYLCHYFGSINLNSPFYTFRDCFECVRWCETLNGRRIIDMKPIVTKRQGCTHVSNKYEMASHDHIMIYNEQEILNKHNQSFMTILVRLIVRAGHIFKFKNQTSPKRKTKLAKIDTCQQFLDIDENEYDMIALGERKHNHTLTATDKILLNKLSFMEFFGIKNSDDHEEFRKFYNEFHDKVRTIKKYENMFYGSNNGDNPSFDYIDDVNNKEKEEARIKVIVDLINRLTNKDEKHYKASDIHNIVISVPQYVHVLKNIHKSLFFKKEERSRELFIMPKNILGSFESEKQRQFSMMLNNIFKFYGIIFEAGQAKGRRRVRTRILTLDKRIKNIVDFKRGRCDKVKGYKNIFK